jgi:transcriptional regulator with XRE-family HTH domain
MQERRKASLAIQIGVRARRIRQMRGLTQKALAANLAGRVDYSYIGKIERGEQLPSLKVLLRIAQALDVPLDYFFSDEAWTEALPEEIRRVRRNAVHVSLLRDTIGIHPADIPLVREILRILARHRRQGRARGQDEPSPQAIPRVAEAQAPYLQTNRQAVSRAMLGIREIIRSLKRGEGEDMVEMRRQLERIMRELATVGAIKEMRSRPGS